MNNNSSIFAILLFFCYTASTTAQSWIPNPNPITPKCLGIIKEVRILSQKVRDTGCDVNLCFLLQGGDSISSEEFEDQRNFIGLMATILSADNTSTFCTVEYGGASRRIAPLTRNTPKFLRNLRKAQRVGGFQTNIGPYLGYSAFQLRSMNGGKKIIILGDDHSGIHRTPTRLAKKIKGDGTDIYVISVDDSFDSDLPDIFNVDSNQIVSIDYFSELCGIIPDLVNDICEFSP